MNVGMREGENTVKATIQNLVVSINQYLRVGDTQHLNSLTLNY